MNLLMAGLFLSGHLPLAGDADIVFTNEKIHTFNKKAPVVEAVAAKDDKFLDVGSAKDTYVVGEDWALELFLTAAQIKGGSIL